MRGRTSRPTDDRPPRRPVARAARGAGGTSEKEIDLYFGWNERLLKKAMRVHYASMSIRERRCDWRGTADNRHEQ